MSYVATAGNVLTDLYDAASSYAGKAVSVAEAGKLILEDPALAKVTGLVMELNKLEQPKAGSGGSRKAGIGLNKVITPLRTYVAARRNPIIGFAIIAAIVGIPAFAGYLLGRRR